MLCSKSKFRRLNYRRAKALNAKGCFTNTMAYRYENFTTDTSVHSGLLATLPEANTERYILAHYRRSVFVVTKGAGSRNAVRRQRTLMEQALKKMQERNTAKKGMK